MEESKEKLPEELEQEKAKAKVEKPPESSKPAPVRVTVAPGLKVPSDMLAAVKLAVAGKDYAEVVIVAVGPTQVVFEASGTPFKLTVREVA